MFDVSLADYEPNALMAQLSQVKLGQMIEVLDRLCVESLDFEQGGSKYSVRLHGPYYDYDTILLYKDDEVSMKFSF